jgi:hypothetical protein
MCQKLYMSITSMNQFFSRVFCAFAAKSCKNVCLSTSSCVCQSVFLHVTTQEPVNGFPWNITVYCWVLLRFVDTFQLSFSWSTITDTSHEDLHAFMRPSCAQLAKCLLKRKMFRSKVVENNETFCVQYTFSYGFRYNWKKVHLICYNSKIFGLVLIKFYAADPWSFIPPVLSHS